MEGEKHTVAILTPEKMREIGEAFERFQATKELDPGIIEYIFTALDHINESLTSVAQKDTEEFFKVMELEKRVNELDETIKDLQRKTEILHNMQLSLYQDVEEIKSLGVDNTPTQE